MNANDRAFACFCGVMFVYFALVRPLMRRWQRQQETSTGAQRGNT